MSGRGTERGTDAHDAPSVSLAGRFLARVLAVPVLIYRYGLSPVLPRSCRYAPTCSAYMLEALATHGPIGGLWLGVRRILRCHPWTEGGFDPVPGLKRPSRHDT